MKVVIKQIPEEHANYFYKIIDSVYGNKWMQLKYYGKNIPKLSYAQSKNKIKYNYKKGGLKEKNLDSVGKGILGYFNSVFHSSYNHIFIHKYNDGSKYINPHSDKDDGWCNCNEVGCGFVSVGLGEERKFRLRNVKTRKIIRTYNQKHGMCIKINKKLNRKVLHEVVKTKMKKKPRISITLRHIVN